MINMNSIGLAVTGCKNGYAVLASTSNLNMADPGVKHALQDQRGYLRVTEPLHTYYSACMLADKMALSIYRSSIDSVGSSGGYIGVTLFVPKEVEVEGPAELLATLLDSYWEEFMHPMFGSPLPNKLESLESLKRILLANADRFKTRAVRFVRMEYTPGRAPLYLYYPSLTEVNRLMCEPFHRQYWAGSEVICLPADLQGSPLVSYNTEVQAILIDHTPQGPAIGILQVPQGATYSISRICVNGRIYNSPLEVSLTPSSSLDLEVNVAGVKSFPLHGTLEDLARQRLIRRNGENYLLEPPRVALRAHVSGVEKIPAGSLILLEGANGRKYEGRHVGSGLFQWNVLATGFPYALVVDSGRNRRVINAQAFTVQSLKEGIEPAFNVAPVPKLRPVTPPPTEKPAETSAAGKVIYKGRPIAPWIPFVAGGVLVALLGLVAWLIFRPDDDREDIDHFGNDEIAVVTDSVKPVTPAPKDTTDTQLIIPIQDLRKEILKGKLGPTIELTGFPEGSTYKIDTNVGLIITVPYDEKARTGFAQNAKIDIRHGGALLTSLSLEPEILPEVEDLRNYPHNKQRKYYLFVTGIGASNSGMALPEVNQKKVKKHIKAWERQHKPQQPKPQQPKPQKKQQTKTEDTKHTFTRPSKP